MRPSHNRVCFESGSALQRLRPMFIDEISGVCGFHNAGDKNEFSWTAQTYASSYEVARSTGPQFSAVGCTRFTTSATSWSDTQPLLEGVCHYYLVRPFAPLGGSWGSSSADVERTGVCP